MSEKKVKVITVDDHDFNNRFGEYASLIEQGYKVSLMTAKKEMREYIKYELVMEKP